MKTISEVNNTLGGINRRVDIEKERIGELEDTQRKLSKMNYTEKKKRESMSHGTSSSSQL